MVAYNVQNIRTMYSVSTFISLRKKDFIIIIKFYFFKSENVLTYGEWEEDGDGLSALDDPHDDHTQQLDHREHVRPPRAHVSQVDVVRLVLFRHEDDENPLNKLQRQ